MHATRKLQYRKNFVGKRIANALISLRNPIAQADQGIRYPLMPKDILCLALSNLFCDIIIRNVAEVEW